MHAERRRLRQAGLMLVAAVWLAGCDNPEAAGMQAPGLSDWTRPPPLPPAPGNEPLVYESLTIGPWCSSCVEAGAATVSIDGQPADIERLREGDIVAAHGARAIEAGAVYSWKLRDARKPFVDAVQSWTLLQGPADSVDLHNARLFVMRQPVQILRTAVDSTDPVPASALDVNAGDVVRVSGYRSEDGRILATRVDRIDPADVVEYATARIVGRLTDIDDGRDFPTCFIGELALSTCFDVSGGVVRNRAGEVVAVAGSYEQGADPVQILVQSLTPLGNGYGLLNPHPAPGLLVSMEGLSAGVLEDRDPPRGVVALIGLNFTDSRCEYGAGFTWQANQLWHLEGLVDGFDSVSVVCYLGYSPFDERDSAVTAGAVAGPIEAIDLAAQTLTVMGVTLQLNFVTRLGTSNYVPGYGDYSYTITPLAEIELGSYAVASGNLAAGDGRLLAHTIVVESYEPEKDSLRYYGTPSALEGDAISLLGQRIKVDGETVYIDGRVEPCVFTDAASFFGAQPTATELRIADTADGLLAGRVTLFGAQPPASYCPL